MSIIQIGVKSKHCCFCNKELSPHNGRHIYSCIGNSNKTLSKKEIHIMHLKYNFPELFQKDMLEDLYLTREWSLVDFNTKFDIDFKNMLIILKYHNITVRSHKKAICITRAREKSERTCTKKYGYKNVGQNKKIIEKREATCLKKFGSVNIFSSEQFKTERKVWWKELPTKEKQKYIRSTLLSSSNKMPTSVAERELLNLLIKNGFNVVPQFAIDLLFYDILLVDYNVIIEYNGDYWHGNPKQYKSTDIISFPKGKMLVEEIWNRDLDRECVANDNGYVVATIWESDWDCLDAQERLDFIKYVINSGGKGEETH